MRNVNLLFKTHSKYVPSCFILTMENAIYIKSIFKLKIILLNLEFFVSIASEPNEDIFPTMFWLALYTTLPFQSVINLLVGYNIESLSYLILPTYMVTLSLLSYKVLKFKPQKNKQDK